MRTGSGVVILSRSLSNYIESKRIFPPPVENLKQEDTDSARIFAAIYGRFIRLLFRTELTDFVIL